MQAALNKNIDNEDDDEGEVYFLLEKAPSIHTKRPRRVGGRDYATTDGDRKGPKKSQIEKLKS